MNQTKLLLLTVGGSQKKCHTSQFHNYFYNFLQAHMPKQCIRHVPITLKVNLFCSNLFLKGSALIPSD